MANSSARDLLRRAREQRKQQALQGRGQPSNSDKRGIAQVSEHDPLARVTATGALHCTACGIDVKPADLMGWNAHQKSRRHLQHQQSLAAPKRSRTNEPEESSDVSDRLQTKLTIAQAEDQKQVDAKRRKLTSLAGYGSSSSSSGSEHGDADAQTSNRMTGSAATPNTAQSDEDLDSAEPGSGLPASFFDKDVRPTEASSDDDDRTDGDAGVTGLPSGFFDDASEQKAAGVGDSAPPAETPSSINLEDSLAAFEREVSELPKASNEPLTGRDGDGDEEADGGGQGGDSAAHADQWNTRTQRLVQLRAIIKDGISGMDPDESAPNEMEQGSSSESSSEADYSEFLSWRSGQL